MPIEELLRIGVPRRITRWGEAVLHSPARTVTDFGQDLQELIAFARANPDAVTYASAGRGSGQHVAMAVTAQLAGVKGTIVEAVPRTGTAVLNADDPHVSKMGRLSRGNVIYFTMQTEKGQEGYDRVDGHTQRGPEPCLRGPERLLQALAKCARDGHGGGGASSCRVYGVGRAEGERRRR